MTPAQHSALEAVAGRPLTQADLDALDPLLGYDSRNDVAIADYLSIGRTRSVHVPIAELQAYMQAHGIWWVLKAAAADPQHPGCQAAAAVLEVATARYDNVDLTLSFVSYVFAALVTAELMSAAAHADLVAMSAVPDPIHTNAVSDALNIAEGRLTLGGG
jgi:hypothetical protein